MPALNKFPKGSEWNKWDLHIHIPGTKLSNNYSDIGNDVIDEFCTKLEASDVKVFGLTDYFSASGYFDITKEFYEKFPDSSKVFFPNIELRTSDVVNSANEEVNIHIIFNPEQSELERKINLFISTLKTNKTCDGRRVLTSELNSKEDFEEASTTRNYIKEALIATYGEKNDLSEKVLIFTAANNDGIRTATETVDGKKRGIKRKAVITDEVDKFSNGFFGSSRNVDYFLKENRLEDENEKIERKPVVTGSDAHSFSEIDNWLGKVVYAGGKRSKEPTWIKADLTYEGLRQILYEPESRVFIGDEPEVLNRVRNNPTKYIKTLNIDQVDGYDRRNGIWFNNETIELNSELIVIIGNRGSGKSALTDTMGLLGNSHNQIFECPSRSSEELFSFLNSNKFLKHNYASDFHGEITWHSEDRIQKILNERTDKRIPEKIEYLPQKYLEKICSNIEDEEFRVKLNEVIFGYVDDKDRYGAMNLNELIRYRTNQLEKDIEQIKETLHQKNSEVEFIEGKLSAEYKKEIEAKINNKEQEIRAHELGKPLEINKPEGKENEKITEEIANIDKQIDSINKEIDQLEKEQMVLQKEIEDIKQAKQDIQRQVNALNSLSQTYSKQFQRLGISLNDVVSITLNFEKINEIIEEKMQRSIELSVLLFDDESSDSFLKEQAEVDRLKDKSLIITLRNLRNKKNELTEGLDKPERDYHAYLIQKEEWDIRLKELVGEEEDPLEETLYWLKHELEKIEKDYPLERQEKRRAQEEEGRSIFNKKLELIKFYDSIKEAIDIEIKKYSDELGGYNIAIESGLCFEPSFYDDFFTFINQGVKGSFYGTDSGRQILKGLWEKVKNWDEIEDVFSFVKEIIAHLDFDKRVELQSAKPRELSKQMKQYKTPNEFFDFLLGFDYLQVKYDLKVDSKDLTELSPGERGGLLLIFYLMLDRRDIPLIIDQPEDNLDNKSVYEILVKFLKKAKKRRQIIMVTHNPNLAVVADAEQIVHVSIDKANSNDFDFISGSIENSEINRIVVDILEGTFPAFDNRKLKYRRNNQ